MKQLIKINNGELSFRLKLNYNNVYSRLRMLLGEHASFFADVSTKSTGATWYSDDEAEYTRFSEAPETEKAQLLPILEKKINIVTGELKKSHELLPYVEDIMEIPDSSFIFYRKDGNDYKFILAAWGCRYAHFGPSEPSPGIIREIIDKSGDKDTTSSGFAQGGTTKDEIKPATDVKDIDKIKEKDKEKNKIADVVTPTADVVKNPVVKEEIIKKERHVVLKVVDQNNNAVVGELVNINTVDGSILKESNENGLIEVGNLPCYSQFSISFPNLKSVSERTYVVEPKVEVYEAYIKKLIKYSPLLFVEDQDGNTIQNHDIKVLIAGQETVYNTGNEGMIQLPALLSGQKFIAIDTTNYANTEEFDITPEKAKKPYRFKIKRPERKKIGITVLDKSKKPIANATIDIENGDKPCQQTTGADGRAEFPLEVFANGIVPIAVKIKNKSKIKHDLEFDSEITEYAIQISDESRKINWKWFGLLPLLALLGWGGYELYKHFDTPTIDEMKSGVALVLNQTQYYVDFGIKDITIGGNPCVAYFTYNSNKGTIDKVTFNPKEREPSGGSGTAFLISEDGLLATNKHVADPYIPQKEAEQFLRKFLQELKAKNQKQCEDIQDTLDYVSISKEKRVELFLNLKYRQQQYRNWDQILTTGNFEVKKKTQLYVAFTGTKLDSNAETMKEIGFISCNHLISGDTGDQIDGADVAIIQLKNKEKDIPEGTYIFDVPKVDILKVNEYPKNRQIHVIGYNAGLELQNLKKQKDGLQPQVQSGDINNISEKYRIGYGLEILGGSSGSPVVNDDGKLVAINNSGLRNASFCYGIRTKYLREILDKLLTTEETK